MGIIQLGSKLRSGNTEVLAIHCGDYRFQAGFHEFLNKTLSLNGNYDLMVIPGGPLSLRLIDFMPNFSWASWKWFRFFVERHGIRRVVLVQHQDCAWYLTMPAHLHDSPVLRKRQEQDLERIKKTLQQDLPQLIVELYYAGWDSSGQITIESIPGR